jgi:hypothetical protein
MARLIVSDSPEELAELFWDVAGFDEAALNLIVEAVSAKPDDQEVSNISTLIEKAIPQLAFSNPGFAGNLLGKFAGKHREQLVEAFAYQAGRFSGGAFAGNPDDYIAQRQTQFAAQTAAFPDEMGLEDLARALRKRT